MRAILQRRTAKGVLPLFVGLTVMAGWTVANLAQRWEKQKDPLEAQWR